MINMIFILFTFLFLIYEKIILLNEETLILLCFIIFTSLSINSFGNTLKEYLNDQSNKIKQTLKNSLSQVYTLLTYFSSLNTMLKNILDNFHILGNYYYELFSLVTRALSKYNNYRLVTEYNKRLNFISKVEKQTVRLLPIIIIQKLSKIIKLKQFCNISVKNNYFSCLHAVSIREYFQLVSLKK